MEQPVIPKDQSELVMYPFNGGTGHLVLIPSNVKKIENKSIL